MTTQELIEKWRRVYREYHGHLGTDIPFDEFWIAKSNQMIDYWLKQDSGEVSKLWNSFTEMLFTEIKYYETMNANYVRGMPKVEMKGTGGRWLP